jgi:hypothetical protein
MTRIRLALLSLVAIACTSITAEPRDRIVTLRFADILTVTDGGNLKLNGNLVTSATTTLTLQSDGTNWWEIARCAT